MEVSMTQAALSAALSFFIGILLGAFYDVIRLCRLIFGFDVASPFGKGKKSAKKWFGYIFVCVFDFLFFAVSAAVMCVFFFLSGDGRMRGYVLFCTLVGFLLYYNTVGRLFISVSAYTVSFCKRIIFLPIRCAVSLLKKGAAVIFKLPIVTVAFTRYNTYINKRKIKAEYRARKKRMKKGGYCHNGGEYGHR